MNEIKIRYPALYSKILELVADSTNFSVASREIGVTLNVGVYIPSDPSKWILIMYDIMTGSIVYHYITIEQLEVLDNAFDQNTRGITE